MEDIRSSDEMIDDGDLSEDDDDEVNQDERLEETSARIQIAQDSMSCSSPRFRRAGVEPREDREKEGFLAMVKASEDLENVAKKNGPDSNASFILYLRLNVRDSRDEREKRWAQIQIG
ncbi:MAG: hypothetical protein LQ341_005086 [Variospora aurantia]|nr:MAG: hypothetical protein LQ341_005086 [Variospora aurantia]